MIDKEIPMPCPACGEQQAYSETTPSRPMLTERQAHFERGRIVWKRETYWHQHCRRCGVRLILSKGLMPPTPPRWRLTDAND